jgi:hypothetical protein
MKVFRKVKDETPTAEQQVKGFIARFEPKCQALIRSIRNALRKRFPSANELVYNYSKNFVIGYSPTEGGIDSPVAISLGSEGLRLYFNQGPKLPDPKKILLGSGKQTRFIWIESPGTLNLPGVEALLKAAIAEAKTPFSPSGRGELIIKSTSAKRQTR